MLPEINVIRTIHPVGQGAFYSEKFMCGNGKLKMVVYDCGAQNRDIEYLRAELSSYFQNDKVIDVFFVSHFDEDHINGIKLLKDLGVKIKTVVVPLVDKKDRWFYVYTVDPSVWEAIDDPKTFFGADTVIRVRPVSEEGPNENEEIYTVEEGGDRYIPSGTRISLPTLSQYWVYIPYNFEEDKRRSKLLEKLNKIDDFKDEVNKRGGKIEDLLHDEDFIRKKYTKINNAYKEVCTDGANRCSLVVYSGPIERNYAWVDSVIPYCCGYGLIGGGCLYLGDTDLNQGSGQNKIVKQLKMYLRHYVNKIGTIQLPHHGAIKNFNDYLLSYNKKCKLLFASFGDSNTYGHPSYDVIGRIINSGNIYCGVNEKRGSGLVENIILNRR